MDVIDESSSNQISFFLFLTHLSLPQLEADVIGCNVYSDGRVAAIDTWNPLSPRRNVLDDDQVHHKLLLYH
jgi:hypothetical protein